MEANAGNAGQERLVYSAFRAQIEAQHLGHVLVGNAEDITARFQLQRVLFTQSLALHIGIDGFIIGLLGRCIATIDAGLGLDKLATRLGEFDNGDFVLGKHTLP